MKALIGITRFLQGNSESRYRTSSEDDNDKVTVQEEDFSMYIGPRTPVKHESSMNKLHPIIHWNPEPTLNYLEPLTLEKHFVAYCKDYKSRRVEGNFIFDPIEGVVLPAGEHVLTVNFIPLKSFKYMSAYAERTITVLKRTPKLSWNNPLIRYGVKESPSIRKSIAMDLALTQELIENSTEPEESSKTSVVLTDVDFIEPSEGPTDLAVFATSPPAKIKKLYPVLTMEDSTLPTCQLLYGESLQAFHFEGATCELTEGKFYFSHNVGDKLEIGKHIVTVEYEPSDSEKQNYTRAYASYIMHCDSNWVPMQWPLDAEVLKQLIYPAPLPAGLFTASPIDPHIEGPITYYPDVGAVLNAGTHTLMAEISPVEFTRYRVSVFTVQVEVAKCPVELVWNRPVAYFDGDLLDSFVLKASNTLKLPGTYAYDPPAGSYLPKGLHKLSVEFIPDDSTNYERGYTTTQMRILPKRELTLYWPDPVELMHPAPLTKAQLNACITGMAVKGEWKFEPPLGTVLDAGVHKLQATFYPVKASVVVGHISQSITIHQAISRIYWPEPDSLLDGEAIFESTLNCRCVNVPSGGTFKYTPGKGTPFKAGTYTLHVHFTPHDTLNYTEAETSVKLLVREKTKVTPKLKWQNPACPPILYNSPLLDDFMNPVCTNRVRGVFHFDPPVGTRLTCGEHTLKATFVPFDHILYADGEFILSTITVVKASPVIEWNPVETLWYYAKPLTYEEHLNAHCVSSNIEGVFTYTPKVGTILEAGEHNLKVVFTPADTQNFFDITEYRTIFIRRGIPPVIWNEPKDPLIYPTYLSNRKHLNAASMDPKVTGVFKYNYEQGAILPVGTHTITCRFYPDDIINYMSADCKISITVVKGTPSIIWLPEFILVYETPLNSTQHCNAKTELKGGQFIYDPPLGTVLLAAEKVKFTMRYIPLDTDNYHEVYEVRYLRIDRKCPVLAWELPPTVDFGVYLSEEQLCARLHETENSEHALEVLAKGTYKYSPTFGSTPSASVTTPLTVTFIPPYGLHPLADNYCEATKEVNICVKRARPVILWKPRYLNIVEGSPITEAQINAKLEKPLVFRGVLVYNHNIGDILKPGRYKVECEFVADEPQNCLPSVMSIAIEVLKKPPKIVWEVDPISGQLKSRKIIEK